MQDYDFVVGIDWATETHQVCILDGDGGVRAELAVAHSGAGVRALVAQLARLSPEAARIAVAIEVPRGAVIDAVLAHGCHVFAVNPKQLDRFRDRHTIAGAKDDRRDAFVLADALRTDRRAYRLLRPEEPRVTELRELSRLHGELAEEHTRLSNRLREQLLRFFPEALATCGGADEPWLWSLLERAPTPAEARRLRPSALRALLAEHRIRRVTAETLHEALQAEPLPVGPGTTAAAVTHVALLLPRLRLVHEQRAQCQRRLERTLDELAAGDEREHRDVTIIRSVAGVGTLIAATMLAEAPEPLAQRDYQTLRAHTGVAPVTRQSGKSRRVAMRRSCNPRLRTAVFHWARNSIRFDPRARKHYDRLRQHHGHARALRGVADRLLAMLVTMLKNGTLYDPMRRGAIAS
jgi:transposase